MTCLSKARKETSWLTAQGPGGEEIRIPVATIYGKHDGPNLVIVAGVHGSEYVGIEATKRLYQTVDPESISGSVVTIPCLSLPAFYGLATHVNPIDQQNPARVFPGSPTGTHSERMVNLLWEQIAKKADFLIDVHGGDLEEELVDFSLVNLTGNEKVDMRAEALALAMDFPVYVRKPKPEELPFASTGLHPLAASYGIPAVLTEVGSHGELPEHEVATNLRVLQNALYHLNMLPGTPSHEHKQPTVLHRFTGINAHCDGFWYPSVKKGDIIRKGQLIGEMRGFFHEPLGLAISNENAYVLGVVTTPPRRKGEMLIGIGTFD